MSDSRYTVLIVSSSDKFNTFTAKALMGERYETVDIIKSVSAARRLLLERNYDIIVINTPVADEFGVDFAIDISNKYNVGIVLVVANEIYDDITEKAVDNGIFTIPKPITNHSISRGVRLLCAMQSKFKSAERKVLTLEEKMDEIRVVNKAKWLLIQNEMLSEDEAHKYIGKQAMDRCVSRRVIAEEIIEKY